MSVLFATVRFELNRVMTAGRITWWFVLAGFPVLISALIRVFALPDAPDDVDSHLFWSAALYGLVPCITSAMGVLLSAAPAIATELEQRSWVYMATRPNGVFWLLLGKYVVAVLWAATASVAGLSASIWFAGQDTSWTLWWGLSVLSALSAMSYAAVYLLIGSLFPQRAMLFCVAWTAVAEGFISFIPAIINRITVQFRLRTLFVMWLEPGEEISNNPLFAIPLADGHWSFQILWLVSLTSIFLAAAQVIAHRREFTAASESDV